MNTEQPLTTTSNKDEEIRQAVTKLLDGDLDLNQFLTYLKKFIASDKK